MTEQLIIRAAMLALCLNIAGLLAAPGNGAGPANPLSPAAAWAQDDDDDGGDDDGDDDDDDFGGDGGGDDDDDDRNEPAVLRQPRATPVQAAVPLPDQAPDQVIVSGLGDDGLDLLLAADFAVLGGEGDDAPALLRIPQGMSVDTALTAVTAIVPGAAAAANSYYRNQAGACTADICTHWAQVGWPPAPGRQCVFAPHIGIVDSGVNLDHAMLQDADIRLDRLTPATGEPSQLRHGTAVVAMFAGSADGRVPGLAPDARLHVVDPFVNAAGGDERADAFGLITAIDTLVAADVDVVNLSLAGPANGLLQASIERAEMAGVPVVAAVGNAGPRAEPLYPAGYQSVIAVSAVDAGGAIYRRAVQGEHVDFVAPGVGVATAASISGVRPQTGTSFAAPFVTMAVAAARAQSPEAEVPAIVDALARNSLDLGDAGRDAVFGWGLVQVPDPCVPITG